MKTALRILMTSCLVSLALAGVSLAQLPRQINYQAYITDAAGHAITGTHNITIKLYDASSTMIYSETFSSVSIQNGVCAVVLGSTQTIPQSVAFDQQYRLGITVDGGTELAPQTPLTSAPYAIRAGSLDANATVVTTVNGQSGTLTLQGGGGTTITNNGTTFTISSSGSGGTGIQGVQNTDGSLQIQNPNGPTATISIANGGVKNANIAANAVGSVQIAGNSVNNAHIADGTISPSKLSSAGASNGQVLSWNGTAWSPATVSGGGGGLTLPYSNSASNNGVLFSLTNSGSGDGILGTATGNLGASGVHGHSSSKTGVGVLGTVGSSAGIHDGSGVCGTSDSLTGVSGNTNDGTGVLAYAAGTGNAIHATVGSGATSARAGFFEMPFSTNAGDALDATTSGTGSAGHFAITNTSGTVSALNASNSGSGDGIFGEGNYNAIHGYSHTVSKAHGKNDPAISGVWNGVFGETDFNSGYGVKGENNTTSTSGIGVYGYAAGYGVYGQSDTNYAVYGYGNSGYGVYGTHISTTGSKAGVAGFTSSTTAGSATDGTVGAVAIYGESSPTSTSTWTSAIRGLNKSTSGNGIGVSGYHNGSGYGVYGYSSTGIGGAFSSGGGGEGIYASSSSGYGGYFSTSAAGTTAYAIYCSGHAYKSDANASWTIASDERLKQDIRPFTDGLDIISQINPIWFRYNGKAGTNPDADNIGVLAQQMQRLAPYTVAEAKMRVDPHDSATTDMLTYNPSALTYIQINAIKELNNKLNSLMTQMQQMQQTISTLSDVLKQNGITIPAGVVVTH